MTKSIWSIQCRVWFVPCRSCTCSVSRLVLLCFFLSVCLPVRIFRPKSKSLSRILPSQLHLLCNSSRNMFVLPAPGPVKQEAVQRETRRPRGTMGILVYWGSAREKVSCRRPMPPPGSEGGVWGLGSTSFSSSASTYLDQHFGVLAKSPLSLKQKDDNNNRFWRL